MHLFDRKRLHRGCRRQEWALNASCTVQAQKKLGCPMVTQILGICPKTVVASSGNDSAETLANAEKHSEKA